jgi:hypothetical protein
MISPSYKNKTQTATVAFSSVLYFRNDMTDYLVSPARKEQEGYF